MINPESLKEVMRAWATGVAIVTGRHENLIHGMTVNSFNSIALEPPTVLVALQQHTRTRNLVIEGGIFGVSILDSAQVGLARRFAGQIDPNISRFENVATFELETGAPLIAGAIAFLDCKVIKHFDVGNTTVFLGEVIASKLNENEGHHPLLYFNRQWRGLEGL